MMIDPAPPRRRLPGLPALAATAWGAWLALLALMAATLAAGPWHAHFLPVATVAGVFLAAVAGVVVGGAWRLVRGPNRLRAATWLSLGVAPALILAGHVLYGLRLNSSRILVLDWPIKLLATLAEPVMDLEARFRYPERTEGETVVMIAAPSSIAREQVAAMDVHVRALRERLGGRSTDRKIHWVRGPLLGASGRAALGTCMGSDAGQVGEKGDPLASLDRHEVAHCVMNCFVPALQVDPPALLVEGWAEANSGRSREDVRRQVWDPRRIGEERSLRVLVGPSWYHAHAGVVYPQGAILVDHILDAHGPDKFLELYRTCRPETFEVDCRRVLGVGLDELDAACRAEVDRAAPPEPNLADALAALELRPEVDVERWKSFTGAFVAGIERSRRLYDEARATVEMKWSATIPAKGPDGGGVRWTRLSSGPRRAVMESDPLESGAWAVWSAAPGRSFRAVRDASAKAWKMEKYAATDAAYRRIRVDAEHRGDPIPSLGLGPFRNFKWPEGEPRPRVVALEAFREPGGRRARVRVQFEIGAARSAECVFDADRGMTILSEVWDFADGGKEAIDYRYDDGDPPPLRSRRLTGSGPGQNDRVVEWTVTDREFGPIPDEAFAPEALLDGPFVVGPLEETPWTAPETFADWYPAPLAAGAAAIVVGLILGAVGGFRRPTAP